MVGAREEGDLSDFATDVLRLLSSRHYHELAAFDPPFDPLEILGVSGRELSYSNVLSWLLGDSSNRQFRQSFLSWLVKKSGLDLGFKDDEPNSVKREFGDSEAGRADLFVNFHDLKLVVAIEVKVWAAEGENQISRYQDFLARRFPESKRMVVYLTRFGDPPASADENSRVPVLDMSWREIAEMASECVGRGEENEFRVQFARHVSRSVLMERDSERKLVLDLLKQGNNARTIKRIVDNYPDLGDREYIDRWMEIVSKATSISEQDFDLVKYPKSGEKTKELKITVPSWKDKGLSFTLMLYRYEKSAVQVLLAKDDYSAARESLDEFSNLNTDIVGNYPQIRGWSVWRSVLKSHGDLDYPGGALIEGSEIFEESFWEQVKQRLQSQLIGNELLDRINQWPSPPGL